MGAVDDEDRSRFLLSGRVVVSRGVLDVGGAQRALLDGDTEIIVVVLLVKKKMDPGEGREPARREGHEEARPQQGPDALSCSQDRFLRSHALTRVLQRSSHATLRHPQRLVIHSRAVLATVPPQRQPQRTHLLSQVRSASVHLANKKLGLASETSAFDMADRAPIRERLRRQRSTWLTELRSDGPAVGKRRIIVVVPTTVLPVVVEKKRSRHRLLVATTTVHLLGGAGPDRDRRQGDRRQEGPATTTDGPRDGSSQAGEIALMTAQNATVQAIIAEATSASPGSRIAATITKKKLPFSNK